MLKKLLHILLASGIVLLWCRAPVVNAFRPSGTAAGQRYYVSSSEGDDDNDGLSQGAPLASLTKINSLSLQPGDSVLLKCGDTWRGEMLTITRSGSADNLITFGSYPSGCADQPVISGAQPITGWTLAGEHIYVADLAAGENAGKFALGINQLFQDGERLTLGRWPNLDAGDSGYATIDAQPASDQITDDELPAVDWTGAMVHIKGMRWYILNRVVTATLGTTLQLNSDAGCWGSGNSCPGWGYFINHHRQTLDQEGEWYYDAVTHRVHLYSEGGMPTNIAGSVILTDDGRDWGGVVLGEDLGDHITHVVIENLDIRQWYRHGIATPTNLRDHEPSHVTIRDNTVRNVDGTGIKLATWVYAAQDGENGWRGGNHMTVSGNIIDGANHKGIDTYTKHSVIEDNTVRNIGLIENLGVSGMGCGVEATGGQCTEDGDGIRVKVGNAVDSGNHNIVARNLVERVAYNGIDVFGHTNTFENNVIRHACYAKGDCGAIRTFGRDNLSETPVYDLVINGNIIVDIPGNTDGCREEYRPLFGFGLYIDHYSRDVAVTGNAVISATAAGILYQNSTGSITGNTLYNNSAGSMYSAQVVVVGGAPAHITEHRANVLYALKATARSLSVDSGDSFTASDDNYFFHPYVEQHISVEGSKTLAAWQAYSGLDGNSKQSWFMLEPDDPPISRVFYNPTAEAQVVDLGYSRYLDLDQNDVVGSLTLPPFSAQVLVVSGDKADLSVALHMQGKPDIAPGSALSYTLAVENRGMVTATNVVLTNAIPSEIGGTTWMASSALSPAAARTGARYVWDLPDLPPGAAGTITVTGAFSTAMQTGVALAIPASIHTPDPESDIVNNHTRLLLGTWRAIYVPLVKRHHQGG